MEDSDDAPPKIEPDYFDLVILGTGLEECILASAAAKAGRSVLHLDRAGNYGSQWSSFTPRALQSYLQPPDVAPTAAPPAPADSRELQIDAARGERDYYDGVSFTGDLALLGSDRGFSLDLAAPPVMFCAGEMINTLIRCGAHAYLEFKAVEASYILLKGSLLAVPASRSEVFQSTALSAVDKRVLMRFLKSAMDSAPGADGSVAPAPPADADRLFADTLRAAQLSPSLQAVVTHAIALLDSAEGVDTKKGMAALHRYTGSLGRFTGAGALLLPLYGTGELPQAFARLAAVGGALYVLRCPATSVLLEGHPEIAACAKAAEAKAAADAAKAEAAEAAAAAERAARGEADQAGDAGAADADAAASGGSGNAEAKPRPALPPAPLEAQQAVRLRGGQVIRCGKLAGNGPHLNAVVAATRREPTMQPPPQQQQREQGRRWASRGICVLDGPVVSDKQQALLVVPPGSGPLCARAVLAMQMGPSSAVVPAGKYVLHLCVESAATSASASAEGELRPALDALLAAASSAAAAAAPSTSASASATASSAASPGVDAAPGGAEAAEGASAEQPAALPPPAGPRVLWGAFFRQRLDPADPSASSDGAAVVCAAPERGPSCIDAAVARAEAAFAVLFPGEAFLPSPAEGAAAAAAPEDEEERDAEILRKALEAVATTSSTTTVEAAGGGSAAGSPPGAAPPEADDAAC